MAEHDMDVDSPSPSAAVFSANGAAAAVLQDVEADEIHHDQEGVPLRAAKLNSEDCNISSINVSLSSTIRNFHYGSEHGRAKYRSTGRDDRGDDTGGYQFGGKTAGNADKEGGDTATIRPFHTKGSASPAFAFITSSLSASTSPTPPPPDLTPLLSLRPHTTSTSEYSHSYLNLTPEEKVAAYALPLLSIEQYRPGPSAFASRPASSLTPCPAKACAAAAAAAPVGLAREQYGQELRVGALSSSRHAISESERQIQVGDNNDDGVGGARYSCALDHQPDSPPVESKKRSTSSADSYSKRRPAAVPIPLPFSSTSTPYPLCTSNPISSTTGLTPRSARSTHSHPPHGYWPYLVRTPRHNSVCEHPSAAFSNSGSTNNRPRNLLSLNSSASSTFSRPSWLDMSTTTSSLVVDSSIIPTTPIISKTPVTPGSSGGSSRINSPGMSLARKRRAPAWPSPRTDLAASPGTARDLSTMYTPAALKVPPTAQYSPAFHRSGYAAPPPLLKSPVNISRPISASAPMPSAAKLPPQGLVPTGRVKVSGIPQDYIVTQLNSLAKKFWFDPSSADCTVLPRKTSPSPPQTAPDSAMSMHSNQPGRSFWPPTPLAPGLDNVAGETSDVKTENVISSHRVTRGRRGSLPDEQAVPVLVFPLHKDYLITQSSLFRSLLSASPLAHLNLPPPTSPRRIHARTQSMADPRSSAASLTSSQDRVSAQRAILARKGARVLPQKSGEGATIFVPLPDPGSFGVIVHWLYWGNVSALESALNKGLVTWQGIVKNIEYLGLDDNVKKVMGKWWRKWVKTEGGRRVSEGDADRRKRRGAGWKRKTMGAGGAAGGVGAVGGVEEWDDGESDEEEGSDMDERREISPLPNRTVGVEGDEEVSGLLRAL